MKTIFSILIISFFIIIGCSSFRSQNNEINIIKEANEIAIVLKTKDLNKISKVCTEQGLISILDWTDSLKNEKLMTVIIDKLSSNTLVYSISQDGSYRIGIDEKDMNDGNNVGDITIVIQNGKARIDEYMGGISVH
ncbi:MAG: hypothetical protein ACK46O_09165 [Flavobacteriia bacterium]|jgi:hypothetical protein